MKKLSKPNSQVTSYPNSQVSLVLYKLIYTKRPLTVGDFQGYPRISEYIRILRKKYNLDTTYIVVLI